MATRDFTITLGDPDDFTNQSVQVTITADDVSDSAIQASVKDAAKFFGSDLEDCFYEDKYSFEPKLRNSVFQKFKEHGDDIEFSDRNMRSISVQDGPDEVSFTAIVMAYVGFSLENFSWDSHEEAEEIGSIVRLPETSRFFMD